MTRTLRPLAALAMSPVAVISASCGGTDSSSGTEQRRHRQQRRHRR